MIMRTLHVYQLVVNISSKINHQILIVFLINLNIFNFQLFSSDLIVKILVVDCIFNIAFVDMHFIYTHNYQT